MTPNEKFPLVDGRLQPTAVRSSGHLLSIAGPSALDLLFPFFFSRFGSWTEQQRDPGLQASREAAEADKWNTRERLLISNSTGIRINQPGDCNWDYF